TVVCGASVSTLMVTPASVCLLPTASTAYRPTRCVPVTRVARLQGLSQLCSSPLSTRYRNAPLAGAPTPLWSSNPPTLTVGGVVYQPFEPTTPPVTVMAESGAASSTRMVADVLV